MDSEKLLACPFCGGEARRVTLTEADGPDNEGGDVIFCTRCQASSHVEFGFKENLVSRWNTRPTPENGLREALELVQRARMLIDRGCADWHEKARALLEFHAQHNTGERDDG